MRTGLVAIPSCSLTSFACSLHTVKYRTLSRLFSSVIDSIHESSETGTLSDADVARALASTNAAVVRRIDADIESEQTLQDIEGGKIADIKLALRYWLDDEGRSPPKVWRAHWGTIVADVGAQKDRLPWGEVVRMIEESRVKILDGLPAFTSTEKRQKLSKAHSERFRIDPYASAVAAEALLTDQRAHRLRNTSFMEVYRLANAVWVELSKPFCAQHRASRCTADCLEHLAALLAAPGAQNSATQLIQSYITSYNSTSDAYHGPFDLPVLFLALRYLLDDEGQVRPQVWAQYYTTALEASMCGLDAHSEAFPKGPIATDFEERLERMSWGEAVDAVEWYRVQLLLLPEGRRPYSDASKAAKRIFRDRKSVV